ncbi:hypothetical protein IAD21_02062 [Abditibacteriota bacterium]|nr:hypothetical protein IAD21_02062 [Abditibacteriota bacterium]
MPSETSVPLTHFDATLCFLRVQLWVVMVNALLEMPRAFAQHAYSGMSLFALANALYWVLPIVVLVVFPRLLAMAVCEARGREPLHAANLRGVVGRWVGLALFIGSLGGTVRFTLLSAEFLKRRSHFGLNAGAFPTIHWWELFVIISPLVLGFALAFGPAIRDNFRKP